MAVTESSWDNNREIQKEEEKEEGGKRAFQCFVQF